MAQNNETRIPRSEILKLYESSLNEVSAHSCSGLISKTPRLAFVGKSGSN